jgi:hypothetical protein
MVSDDAVELTMSLEGRKPCCRFLGEEGELAVCAGRDMAGCSLYALPFVVLCSFSKKAELKGRC